MLIIRNIYNDLLLLRLYKSHLISYQPVSLPSKYVIHHFHHIVFYSVATIKLKKGGHYDHPKFLFYPGKQDLNNDY